MFSVSMPEREVEIAVLRPYRERTPGRFLKGPIPLDPIARAARLPGQALAVYLAIHHRVALTRSETVTLPKGLLEQFGISRDSKARSLHALETMFLITVERTKGRTARITLRSSA